MAARALIVKHILREGPGSLRDVLQEQRVMADVVELARGEAIPPLDGYGALIVLGGPASANDATPAVQACTDAVRAALASDVPYLGICLGHQILAAAAGGTVAAGDAEIGFGADGRPFEVELTEAGRRDALFAGVPATMRAFQLHRESVSPAAGIEVLATSVTCSTQAIRVGRRAYGLQMHLELVPEVLAVWSAQEPMLAHLDPAALQAEYAAVHQQYATVARTVFTNFLTLADLAAPVDVTESPSHA